MSDSDIEISPANNGRNHGPNPFGVEGETFNLATAKANEEKDERAEFLKLINEGVSPSKRVTLSH